MSIKIENLIKITTEGSYLLLTPEEYRALTGQTPAPVALKDINWNGQMPELVKDQRIAELQAEIKEKDELLAWAHKNNLDDNHNFKVVRDKQKDEIEKLRCELDETRKIGQEFKDRAAMWEDMFNNGSKETKRLTAELEAMTLKAKGMVEKPYWKAFPETVLLTGHGKSGILSTITDHGTAEVLAELLAEGDIEPVEPTPSPEPEPIAEVTPELETVPEPVFNDTAVAAEEVTPTKKQNTKKWQAEQFTGYIEMIKAGSTRDNTVAQMMEDLHVTKTTGMALYYKWVKQAAPIKELVKKVPPPPASKPKKPEPVKIIKPARISSLPEHILKQLDELPVYPTVNQFKDKLCKMHDMSHYPVAQLKLAYKETHKNLTW